MCLAWILYKWQICSGSYFASIASDSKNMLFIDDINLSCNLASKKKTGINNTTLIHTRFQQKYYISLIVWYFLFANEQKG